MIELLGFMIAGYGSARLVQTSTEAKNTTAQVAGILGIIALVVLALMLHEQATQVSSSLSGL